MTDNFEDAQLKHLAQAMDRLFDAMKPKKVEEEDKEDEED